MIFFQIGADGRRNQVFLALSTAAEFREHLTQFSDFYSNLGELTIHFWPTKSWPFLAVTLHYMLRCVPLLPRVLSTSSTWPSPPIPQHDEFVDATYVSYAWYVTIFSVASLHKWRDAHGPVHCNYATLALWTPCLYSCNLCSRTR